MPQGVRPSVIAASPAIQRNVIIAAYERDRRKRTAQYHAFVSAVEAFGMPVRFLRSVGKEAKIHTERGSLDRYLITPFEDTLRLTDETMNDVADMSLTRRSSQTLGVQTIYHESTHAYLYLHKNNEPIRSFYARGTQYYQGAGTAHKRTTSDPEMVFQEACAVYVGNRAAAWWLALYTLSMFIAKGMLTPKWIDYIRTAYDKTMTEVVVGYSVEGGEQDPTTRPIDPGMRAFLDSELLENKITDKFDQVPLFSGIIAQPQLWNVALEFS